MAAIDLEGENWKKNGMNDSVRVKAEREIKKAKRDLYKAQKKAFINDAVTNATNQGRNKLLATRQAQSDWRQMRKLAQTGSLEAALTSSKKLPDSLKARIEALPPSIKISSRSRVEQRLGGQKSRREFVTGLRGRNYRVGRALRPDLVRPCAEREGHLAG